MSSQECPRPHDHQDMLADRVVSQQLEKWEPEQLGLHLGPEGEVHFHLPKMIGMPAVELQLTMKAGVGWKPALRRQLIEFMQTIKADAPTVMPEWNGAEPAWPKLRWAVQHHLPGKRVDSVITLASGVREAARKVEEEQPSATGPHTEAQAQADRSDTGGLASAQAPSDRRASYRQWLAVAMLLVRDNPGWSDAQVAREVGKHPGTLSRSPEYRAAARMARAERTPHHGHVEVDGESGQRSGLEAYAQGADPAEMDWDA